jgi:DNA-binding MarR family transcriptional regulator
MTVGSRRARSEPAKAREVVVRANSPSWAGLRLVVIANHCMQPLYNKLERVHGLARDEAAILVCLSITTAARAQEVARYTGRPKNSISRAVGSLEARGLLSRSAHPVDGRAVCLELTAAGRRAFEDISDDHAATDERLLEVLEPQERRQFVEMLARIAAASTDWT